MVCLVFLVIACASPLPKAAAPPVAPPPAGAPALISSGSAHFEFHSSFWINLHHFLYVAARAHLHTRDSRREAVAGVADELRELESLPAEERRAFESAVHVYQATLAQRDLLFDEGMRDLSTAIAQQESSLMLDAPIDAKVAAALRTAAPVYRALWWGRHDQSNRRWVASVEPLLAQHGAALAERIAGIWSTRWPAERLRVDVCAYADWAGAYTVVRPSRITIGSSDPDLSGSHALEVLFHEAMHGIGSRVPPLLRRKAEPAKKEVPPNLIHALIFYTAGDAVRRRIPAHVPYAESFGVWRRLGFRDLLDQAWRPYLDGSSTLEEALDRIVAAL